MTKVGHYVDHIRAFSQGNSYFDRTRVVLSDGQATAANRRSGPLSREPLVAAGRGSQLHVREKSLNYEVVMRPKTHVFEERGCYLSSANSHVGIMEKPFPKKKARQIIILTELGIFPKMKVHELAQRLSVLQEAIRRDLTVLAEQGKISRSFGGAIGLSNTVPGIDERKNLMIAERDRMSKVVVSRIKPNYVLMAAARRQCVSRSPWALSSFRS
jgi:uncharacterized small protein (DUF1192 family)